MNENIIDYLKLTGATVTAVTSLWAFAKFVKKETVRGLAAYFPLKSDFHRLETKLDRLIGRFDEKQNAASQPQPRIRWRKREHASDADTQKNVE